ncbi:DUF4129 domain-containing protein [Microlunatus elymi]|uniref:DUF4129 domain-containing protein n=1 Tax=Microlunatus elymi TaxID=2596828 RepID=A0A516PYI5_9ACTN|nr:DUF4129 domain-containing protein [Microlunatus elymi]QDP96236.1 DUF4129 domain-containing protein [Microlunatus elymi]
MAAHRRADPAQRSSPLRRSSPPGSGWVAGAMVAILLAVALLIAAIRPPWHVDPIDFTLPTPKPRPMPTRAAPSQTAGAPSHLPINPPLGPGPDLSWIKWVALGLLIAAVAVALALIVARLLAVRRMYETQPDEELEIAGEVTPDLPTLQQGAIRAEERLLAIGNPTDAIIAAWLALEEAADASGVHRQASETPTEFTADVLERTGVAAEPVRVLLGLYLRARFAATPSSATDLDRARQCIRDLADSWQSFAEATPSTPNSGSDQPGSRS